MGLNIPCGIKPKEMIKTIVFLLILALRISYHPSDTSTDIAPFASPSPVPTTPVSALSAKVISIDGSISQDKIVLKWIVEAIESADQFEVEKSTDGKNFSLAALVFGTDKAENGSYEFYDKAGNQKISYRIKIINKNRETGYSRVIEINPNA